MRSSLAPGVWFFRAFSRDSWFRGFILLLTFLIYTCYHMSRKPISVVKSRLHQNCSELIKPINDTHSLNDTTWCSWAPFDKDDYKELLGAVDNAFLVAYAIGMFISGMFGERLPLRYYLSAGMLLSGLFTSLFGLGYFWNIHMLWYFVLIQICNGLVQTTGWPSVVTCVGNWFGKGKRGLIMGVWNSHTSVGNILGSLIAGVWVNQHWGLSFIVPGIITAAVGVLTFLFLIEHPEDVDCTPPQHHGGPDEDQDNPQDPGNGPYSNRESGLETAARCSKEAYEEPAAISFLGALRIPGVVEFSLCLLFAKLVSYTFLYWLPLYISNVAHFSAKEAGDLSTLFDVGGIIDVPVQLHWPERNHQLHSDADRLRGAGQRSLRAHHHRGLRRPGAALGPLLAGLISPTGWNNVFYMLISADILACLFLCRLVYKEILAWKSSLTRDRGSNLVLTHPR
ncbi:glucose-6-phosphate exchanger SLC37A2 isoform X3 [Lemur catta]|uniref:glucose-6-phosphate exchanger SLC37A2 isoform X3 n=1 Tax=Lemur catta TaxID=9447 RepID=UPI001E26D42D|nr:glucose-6-phosphate exchanger SLC37A2 isoform X3 [Lemur catta]